MRKRHDTTVIMSIEGGLGNQLFQINAARILFKEENLIFTNFCQRDRKVKVEYKNVKVVADCEIDVQEIKLLQRKLLNLCLRMSTWNQSRVIRSCIELMQPPLSLFYSILNFRKTNLVIASGVGYSKPSIKRNT